MVFCFDKFDKVEENEIDKLLRLKKQTDNCSKGNQFSESALLKCRKTDCYSENDKDISEAVGNCDCGCSY